MHPTDKRLAERQEYLDRLKQAKTLQEIAEIRRELAAFDKEAEEPTNDQ